MTYVETMQSIEKFLKYAQNMNCVKYIMKYEHFILISADNTFRHYPKARHLQKQIIVNILTYIIFKEIQSSIISHHGHLMDFWEGEAARKFAYKLTFQELKTRFFFIIITL